MKLITEDLEETINNQIVENLRQHNFPLVATAVSEVLDKMYAAIPESKRISYGKVYCIKELSTFIHLILQVEPDYFFLSQKLFQNCDEHRCTGVALGLITAYGEKKFEAVIPFFEETADSEHWEIREFSQMFFRRIIKKHPEKARLFLLDKTQSPSPNIRRFVAESLRPVRENKWLTKQPDYSLSVLRLLFTENKAYPRTSVGNNLSDLSRYVPKIIFSIVDELVAKSDKNAYWIAQRACRNLVKNAPIRVMNALKTDVYKYKTKSYKRSDYERN